MYHLIIYAAIAAIGALVSAALQKDVQQRVAQWLRQHKLGESALMDVVLFLDMVSTRVRASVKVETSSQRAVILTIERTYSIEQVKDVQLRAALLQRGRAEQNVLSLFNTA